MDAPDLIVRHSSALRDYCETWEAMRRFVDAATEETAEELWLLQHPPVYTLGRAARTAAGGALPDFPQGTNVPIIRSDRGGQITYHGPGQIIAYTLFNLRRRAISLRQFVRGLEDALVSTLAAHGICGAGNIKAPGVYVNGAKIASLGLRFRRGWIYHGLSLNVRMDMRPFADIHPCGLVGTPVTQMADFGVEQSAEELMPPLAEHLRRVFFYPPPIAPYRERM